MSRHDMIAVAGFIIITFLGVSLQLFMIYLKLRDIERLLK